MFQVNQSEKEGSSHSSSLRVSLLTGIFGERLSVVSLSGSAALQHYRNHEGDKVTFQLSTWEACGSVQFIQVQSNRSRFIVPTDSWYSAFHQFLPELRISFLKSDDFGITTECVPYHSQLLSARAAGRTLKPSKRDHEQPIRRGLTPGG